MARSVGRILKNGAGKVNSKGVGDGEALPRTAGAGEQARARL